MANFLVEFVQSSQLMPLPRVLAELEKETDPKRILDFAACVEAAQKIDKHNSERKSYWDELAIWSTRRVGELLKQGKENGRIRLQGKTKSKPGTVPPLRLSDLGIEPTAARRAEALAAIPTPAVMAYVQTQKANGKDVTRSGLMSVSKPKKSKSKATAKAKPDKDEGGGYEPSEAKKPLDKMKKGIAAASMGYGQVAKILGETGALKEILFHIDSASKLLCKFRESFKRKVG